MYVPIEEAPITLSLAFIYMSAAHCAVWVIGR